MLVFYRILSIIIMIITIDVVYFSYKKYIEYVNKKNETSIKAVLPIKYPTLFLLGGLTSVFIYDSTNFFEILKNCYLLGILFLLVYFNIVAIKRILFRTKTNISSFKKIDKDSLKEVFKKKK